MNDALLWNELGKIYIKIGAPEDAIAAYIKAIELKPDSGWTYYNLGNAYFIIGEFGRSLFLFRKSAQLMTTLDSQAAVWNKIGDAYRALKDIDNAIQAYKKADDLSMGAVPTEKEAGDKLGEIDHPVDLTVPKETVQGTDDLRALLPKISTHNEPSIEVQAAADGFQPINNKQDQGENNPSQDEQDTKPVLPPGTTQVTGQDNAGPKSGTNQNTFNPIPGAEKSSLPREKPIIVIQDSSEITKNLAKKGTAQNEAEPSGNSEPAPRQNETRQAKPGTQPSIYPNIENLEEILAKVNIYENITRVNPTNDRAWDTLGKLYKSLGRYQDAIGVYQKAIALASDREVYYYYLGLLYSVEQQNDDAVQAFQFVLRKNPDYILAHSALAGVYHRMGLENKANHHIATALPKMSNESTYNRACFYAICGDTELAFEFLKLALTNKDTTIEWIKSDPDLDPIRGDPRYQKLISEKEHPDPENNKDNYFSSELEGKHNQLLPILNRSLAR